MTTTIPTRFRAGEARAARIGRPLKVFGRVDRVDDALMDRIAAGFMQQDEPGDRLAAALRSRGEGAVSMHQLHTALARGVDAVPDAPPALREFFALVEATPEWVDHDLLAEGARVYRRLGRSAADVLLQLSLIGGYRFGGPTDLLVATGGLTGDTTMRRLGETQQWGIAVSEPDAMRRDGDGWRLTVHVRVMHALVNHRFREPGRWDVERWGLPINQTDQAATLGLFDATLLIGARALGCRVTREDSRAVMHLWRYIGWLMGLDDQWLVDSERERHRLDYHLLLAQDDVTPAGRELAASIVETQPRLHYRRLGWFHRRYQRERLLSMLRVFLGKQGLADLGLPRRPVWATPAIVAKNVVLHHVLGRTRLGERLLHRLADRSRAELVRWYFGDDRPDVGAVG